MTTALDCPLSVMQRAQYGQVLRFSRTIGDPSPEPVGQMQSIGRVVSSLCVVVGVVCADPLPGQSITPKFAWPANSVAELRITGFSVRESNGKRDSTMTVGESKLEGRAHPYGRLIISGPTTGMSNLSAPDATGSLDALMKHVVRYVVRADGRFSGLEDVEATKRSMEAAMAPMTERLRSVSPAAAAAIAKMTTLERLNENGEQAWQQISGMLFGRNWTPGDTAQRRWTQPVPGFAGAEVVTTQVIRHVGVVQCPANSGVKRCWQFESSTSMDMNSLRAAVVATLREMGIDDPGATAQMPVPRTTTTTTLVFDAATSRPLVSTAEMTMDMSGVLGERAVSNSARARTVTTYVWK